MKRLIFSVLTLMLAAGCGSDSIGETANETSLATTAPVVSFEPGHGRTAKPTGPVTISYRIVGKPIVGQPVGVELLVESALGSEPLQLNYRINDATAMQFPKDQLRRVSYAPGNAEQPRPQHVRVIPMREGRLYLNVSATANGNSGSTSTVVAIPIDVGAALPDVAGSGEVTLDENGAAIRSVPAAEK